MKHILAILILFATSSAFAQKLYTRNDSIPITQDSITLKAGPYRGNIQWQKSLDNQNWINLVGETTDSLKVKPDIEAMYRAKVAEGTCMPVYSDSVAIVTADTITKNYVDPGKTGLILISDTTKISTGDYIYTGVDKTDDFEIGKVIIDEQSGGTIRRITDVIQNADTISVKTDQASMEDLFQNTSFKLSTKMVYPSQNLKSANNAVIEKALTDKDGFIHPVEIVYESPDGIRLKSASIFKRSENTEEGTLYMHKDWSGTKFYDLTGTFKLPNKEGLIVSYSGNVKSYISEGYFTFDPEFKFEFEFDRPKINWDNFKISKGEITKFKFYSDRSQIDFKNILAFESNIAYEFGKEWTLVPKIINSKFKFLVGGVPVWIDFKIDINCSLKAKFESGSITTTGFQNTNYLTIGAGYENKEWYTIKEIEKDNQVFDSNSGFESTEVRFDIFPSVEMKLYGIVGPYFKVGPYLSYESTKSLSENWDKKIDLGLEANLGVSVDVFGREIASLNEIKWDFFNTNLWKAPGNLQLINGDNQSAGISHELSNPIVVKVNNSLGQPLNGVQVHFLTSSGIVGQPIVKTDANGLAQTNWTLSANPGEQSLKVYLLDGKDQELGCCSLSVNATATNTITNKPTITTNPITDITQTSATSGGNITSDGGAAITASGVCWSTSQDPTTAINFTTDGNTSSYTSNLTGLTANTTYYVWAYAINSVGTGYGNKESFTTTATAIETGTVTDIDGNVYHTVTIGTQVWMVENLKTTKYNDGTSIPNVTVNTSWSALATGAYCWNNNDAANKSTYGALYNWYTVNTGKLAPTGWHVPSNAEWTILTTFLGGESIAGGKLKEGGYSHWQSPNTGATNETGFTALPAGYRGDNGAFGGIGSHGIWWSSSGYDTYYAWGRHRDMSGNDSTVSMSDSRQGYGFSVRCVRD